MKKNNSEKFNVTDLFVIFFGAITVFLVYFPGITGALYYDDYSNLGGLASIDSTKDALDFVFGGHAGPLGRPLALVSFLPHSAGWPENSEHVLFVNVIIHCLNFILLYILSKLLIQSTTEFCDRKLRCVAFFAAFLWAVLPIIASTTLIAIQRMTGLSSFFGLLGLVAFVACYGKLSRTPRLALILQMSSLGLCTSIAIFAKESAALFPVYALVIDVFLAPRLQGDERYNKIRRFLLLVPPLFVIFYISPLNIDWFKVHELRGFNPWERLNTQAVILWEYLVKAFLPQQPTSYGPFHDYYGVREIGLFTILSIVSWMVLFCFAVVCSKKFRLAAFAILWFLSGHLIESTTVMLELYFEHRNYIALYGPCLAITLGAWSLRGKLSRVLPAVYIVYVTMLMAITLSMTTLWGQPLKAAEIWSVKHPGSARAVLHSVFQGMELESSELHAKNQDFSERERYYNSLMILDRTKRLCPDCINVRLQAMLYSCVIETPESREKRFIEMIDMAESSSLNPGVIDMLFNLSELVEANACEPLGHKQIISLIDRLEKNKQFYLPAFGSKILFLKAMSYSSLGKVDQVYASLNSAEHISPEALPVLQFQVHFAIGNNRLPYAKQALERRASNQAIKKIDPQHFQALKSLVETAESAELDLSRKKNE